MVTKSITLDEDDHDRLIKIVTHKQDSTMKIIINRDGEIEELVLPLDDFHSQKIQDKLAQYDICLDDFSFSKLDDIFMHPAPGGWLGVQILSLSDQLRKYFGLKHDGGVLISEIVADSPAEKAGFKAGDIILKVDDTNISDTDELQKVIHDYDPETVVTIQFIRDRKSKTQKVTLGEAERFRGKHKFGRLNKHVMPGWKGDFDGDKQFKKYMFRTPRGMDDDQLLHFYTDDDEELQEQVDELKKELKMLKEEMKKLTK